jgi:hypothetical protein
MSDELDAKFTLMKLPTKTPTRTRTPTKTKTPTPTKKALSNVVCVKVNPAQEWFPVELRSQINGANFTRVSSIDSRLAPIMGGQGTAYRFYNNYLKQVSGLWHLYKAEYGGIGSPKSLGVRLLYISRDGNINGPYTPTYGVSASLVAPTLSFNRPVASYTNEYGLTTLVNLGACGYIPPTQTPTPTKTRGIYTSPTPTSSPTFTPSVTQTKTRTPTPTKTANFNPTTVISLSGINASFVFRNSNGGLQQLVFTNGILTGNNQV